MSVRGIWGHLTFLVGNVPPTPNGGSCSCTALDHAGHCTTASYWITSVLWMLPEQAGSEIGGGGGNRTPVRKPRPRSHRLIKRKRSKRISRFLLRDLSPSATVCHLKLEHFRNVFSERCTPP